MSARCRRYKDQRHARQLENRHFKLQYSFQGQFWCRVVDPEAKTCTNAFSGKSVSFRVDMSARRYTIVMPLASSYL